MLTSSPAPRLLTQVVTDIRPEPDLHDGYIERNPVVTNVQVAPDMSEHEVRSSPTHVLQNHPSNQIRVFFSPRTANTPIRARLAPPP